MATVLAALADTIEIKLSQGVKWSLTELDPTWELFQNSWTSVSRNEIGQGYKAIHTFSEGLSGAFKWQTAGGPDMNSTTLTHGLIPTSQTGWPGYNDMTLPRYFRKEITLVEGRGNLVVPMEYMRLEKLNTEIADLFNDILRGTAMNVALSQIGAWFNTTGVKSALGSVASISATGAYADISPLGSIAMFYSGQHVDLYDATGATKRNSVQLVVDGVRTNYSASDSGYGSLRLKTKDGSTWASSVTGAVATDLIVAMGSVGVGPSGPDYWMNNTGTIYGINVANYPQFQSLVETSVGALDETAIARRVARMILAWGAVNCPDTIMTTQGVTSYLMDTSFGLPERFNRGQSERKSINPGWEKFETIRFNGKTFKWITSPYMQSDSACSGTTNGGRMWFLKTGGGNIVRYVAPPIGFGSTQSFMASEVPGMEITFPFQGVFGNGFPGLPVWEGATGGVVDSIQMPFWTHVEYAPKQIQGCKLEGLEELL